jgi:cell wall assembly regulator SMI1
VRSTEQREPRSTPTAHRAGAPKKLPEDFRDFYKVHNGQEADVDGLIDAEEILSIDRIKEQWGIWKELYDNGTFTGKHSDPDDGIKDDWWNPRWIPFTFDGAGNHYCLDLDPDEDGEAGQVIRMWHDDAERIHLAYSFGEFIEGYVEDMEAGELHYSEEYGGIFYTDEALSDDDM